MGDEVAVPEHRPTVTAAIVALNEADLIEGCLTSVAWADERLVIVDAATTDNTAELARLAGAKVVVRKWQGWPKQRNAALEIATGEWLLFVDGDERVPPSLAHEIRRRVLEAGETAGFWIPRRNVIAGEWVKHAGWWPDRQLRLLRRTGARYDEGVEVHEVATLDGPSDTLSEPFLHLNYDTLAEFREKQARFAILEAHTLWERGDSAAAAQPVASAVAGVSAADAGAWWDPPGRTWVAAGGGDGAGVVSDLPGAAQHEARGACRTV